VNRFEFLAGAAILTLPKFAQDKDDVLDPASGMQSQALRVLLGRGQAQKIDAQAFLFEGRRYRGTFSFSDAGEVVSTVPLEQYLYSVVSREMPHSWPAAALQAQAVVARTYVLQRSNPTRAYDLVPSEADQVYTGVDAEKPETTAAVDTTAGLVLRFADGFAQALYSSCCGGHTESNADAWGGALLPYLSGVSCTYCNASPWYKWSQTVPLSRVQTALAANLKNVGTLQNVLLDSPDGSGRARFWSFVGSNGTQRVKAATVRTLLGTRTLPSLLVQRLSLAQPMPDSQAEAAVIIEGAGLGHGVGLCQWGARGMALTGADVRAILAYYYPGTGIGND
jgi:stage II sporulation protein D